MSVDIIELVLELAKHELKIDADGWQPGQLTTVLYDLLPYDEAAAPGWHDELASALPQFLDVLRETGRPEIADLLAPEVAGAIADPRLGRLDPVSWSLYRRGGAEPVRRPIDLPLEPLPGSPAPVTYLPSSLNLDAENAELLQQLAEFAERLIERRSDDPDHELWRIAVLAGWICPTPVGPRYGPAMHAWEPDDPDLTPARALDAWLPTYGVVLSEWPELIEPLLTAFRDGLAAAPDSPGVAVLERLGAVRLEKDQLWLTHLGIRGLFTRGRWADPSYWLVDPERWWLTLREHDLIAFLTAASKLCIVDQAWAVQRWFSEADPLEFAYQLVRAGSRVHGAVLNTVFGYLLRIGLEAAPAVEEWLYIEEMAGFGWLWFDRIGAPMAGITAEHAEAMVATEMVQSLDDLRSLLDWYAEYPPDLSPSTIDELRYSIPDRITTEHVSLLLQQVLGEERADPTELFTIIEAARRDLVR